MKRKTRFIQISGISGLFIFLFIASCLIAGFGAFPALVLMKLWNLCAQHFAIPAINFVQGVMLWAIVAISGFIINGREKYFLSVSSSRKLSEEDIKNIMRKVKLQSDPINNTLINSSIENPNKELNKEEEKENV